MASKILLLIMLVTLPSIALSDVEIELGLIVLKEIFQLLKPLAHIDININAEETKSPMEVLASQLRANIDPKVEPCTDFFRFACGRTPMKEPEDLISYSRWNIPTQVRQLVDDFISSCETWVPSDQEKLEISAELAKKLSKTTLAGRSGSWIERLSELAHIPMNVTGRSVFFGIGSRRDERNPLRAEIMVGKSKYDLSKQDYDLIVDNVTGLNLLLGQSFEQLSLLSKALEDACRPQRNEDREQVMTLAELQSVAPAINWTSVFEGVFAIKKQRLSQQQPVRVTSLKCLVGVSNVLDRYNSSEFGGADILADWIYIKALSSNLIRKGHDCSRQAIKHFAAAFVTRPSIPHARKQERDLALEMAKGIKDQYIEMILMSRWQSDHMTSRAVEKVNSTIIRVSFMEKMMNRSFVENYYRYLMIDSQDYGANLRRFGDYVGDIGREDQRFREDFKLSQWIDELSYYNPKANSILLSSEALRKHSNTSWPGYANFGRLGSIIAHEYGHAFDNIGIKHLSNGIYDEERMWGRFDSHIYEVKIDCIKQMYDDLPVEQTVLRSNGSVSIDGNIADSALRAAYLAYRKYEADRTSNKKKYADPDPRLPGLEKWNPRQMFWINTAQVHCGHQPSYEVDKTMRWASHANRKLRVNVPLMNIPEFRDDFSCKNPKPDCRLWASDLF